MQPCLLKIGIVSLAILLSIAFLGCSLEYSKEYLNGVITVDKMNSQGEIDMITIHFKDFPYDVSINCHLSSEDINEEKHYIDSPLRSVYQEFDYHCEEIDLKDLNSPFAGKIQDYWHSIERKEYINYLVEYCSPRLYLSTLGNDNTTNAITFYPKTINGKTCTVLEYTGLMSGLISSRYREEPTSVVGLFMPLNETKEGCDRYLILCSGNQTADWLDSVKVSERNNMDWNGAD
jgi:hypothetical protein